MKNILKHLRKYPLLQDAFAYVLNNNKGNNPYHNTNHLITVFYFCMEMADYYILPDVRKVTLGLVALFHDFNHNGTIGNDDVNLKNAYLGFLDFYADVINDELYNVRMDDIEPETFKMILNHTEFPSRPNPNTIEEKIIMDSDMLPNYAEGQSMNILIGLSKEFHTDIKNQIGNQIKFIENLQFYTDYAQKLHKQNKDKLISSLHYLQSIFN